MTLKIIGGFTGRAGAEVHDVDLDRVSPQDADRLRKLVNDARFFSLPDSITKPAPASWDFVHELTVQDESGTHTVRFYPDAASPELRALAKEVTAVSERGVR